MGWKKSLGAALAVGLTLTLGMSACGDGTNGSRPNIVMILADDLGYSDIGAFGSEISTPNLDALVASGRVLTNYHTGATCSPTRSMLMSGTDHHVAGLGTMAEVESSLILAGVGPWGAGNTYSFSNPPDGYAGYLNDHVLAMPQLLRDGGYHTYMAGKWHLATQPTQPSAMTGGVPWVYRAASFPNAKGFEHAFAELAGAGSHFAPVPGLPITADLLSRYVEDDKPTSVSSDFYSSTSFTDKLISYIDSRQGDGKPFFAYLAFTAPHWPLQAPDEDIAKYRGKYDQGYEVIRARRIAKQKAQGLIPADFNPNPGLDASTGHPLWNGLTAQQKAVEARKMEVYAAMVDNMDRNIGRLIQHLKDIGQYDNTMIVFASDNGAEGGPNAFPDNANTDNSLGNIGRPRSNVTYGERWAEVSATPFRLWKGFMAEGGVSAPMVVRLPRQARGDAPLGDLTHVTDLLPTFLEVAGIENPGSTYAGRSVSPITGVSLLPRLEGHLGGAPHAGQVVADELFTGRYVIRDQWKLVSVEAPFGTNGWSLYDMSADRGETNDLSASRADITAQLTDAYNVYAGRVGVIFAPGFTTRAPGP